jgi:hypothetical protein
VAIGAVHVILLLASALGPGLVINGVRSSAVRAMVGQIARYLWTHTLTYWLLRRVPPCDAGL